MEYASVLAGQPFGAHPRTHPALGELARVNDAVGDDSRWSLAELGPDLIDTATPDPRATPTVLLRCDRAGLTLDPDDRGLRSLRTWLENQLHQLDRHPLLCVTACVTVRQPAACSVAYAFRHCTG